MHELDLTPAQMDTEMHIRRTLETGSIELHVRIEHLVGCLVIGLVLCPALEHVFRAEVRWV
jgi:hypothetical protein